MEERYQKEGGRALKGKDSSTLSEKIVEQFYYSVYLFNTLTYWEKENNQFKTWKQN